MEQALEAPLRSRAQAAAFLPQDNEQGTGSSRQHYFQGKVMLGTVGPHIRACNCVREAMGRSVQGFMLKTKQKKEVEKFFCSLQRAKAGEAEFCAMQSQQLAGTGGTMPSLGSAAQVPVKKGLSL